MLDGSLQRARDGESSVHVVHGEPGIGKTALLGHAAGRAEGFRVVRLHGAESEAELPCAGLQLLCSLLAEAAGRLDTAQRRALEAAVESKGGEPDALRVGLATLELLTEASAGQPLLLIIDDAQWLDQWSVQVLAFAARRLERQRIAVLIAERDSRRGHAFDDLPRLRLAGLCHADARPLLGLAMPGRADEAVLGRIIAETGGNPRRLLGVAGEISVADFAGGFGVGGVPAGGPRNRLTDVVVRVEALPTASRTLLLLAASDPTGDPALLWRAAAVLGLPAAAAVPLEAHGLLRLGPLVAFSDPAVRAAVYNSATPEQRREAHAALAAGSDRASAADRRAWHRGQAAHTPDERVARELERCALRARERGGPAAAAAFLERAAQLSPDPAVRSSRALVAAAAALEGGALKAVAPLLLIAEQGPLDSSLRARLEQLRARMAFASRRGHDSTHLLLTAARSSAAHDVTATRETYLEALLSAVFTGGSSPHRAAAAVVQTLPAQPSAQHRPADALLDGLVARFERGYSAAHGDLRAALERVRGARPCDGARSWQWLAGRVAAELWEAETWQALTLRTVRQGADVNALAVLPYALAERAIADLHRGEFDSAGLRIEQANAIAAATGIPRLSCASLLLAAWQGEHQRALSLLAVVRREVRDRREGLTLTTANLAQAVLFNGLGRYDLALRAAREAAGTDALGLTGWALMELVEAAVRCGRLDAARCALSRLSERTRLAGTDWALGVEARSRALLTEGDEAEPLYREAIARLGRSGVTVHGARTQLVYGEWLRRQGRRADGRTQLRAAAAAFTRMGAVAFAARAQRENAAAGGRPCRPKHDTRRVCTPEESRVAFLARDGLTNAEIGTRLFISPRTVEYHLHKVFEKFGITSRRELHLILDNAVSLAAPVSRAVGRKQASQVRTATEVA